MGKIIIKGLKVFAYHGVNPEEKVDGQNFVIDIIAELNTEKAYLEDNVEDTVSYAKMIKTAIAVFTEKSYDLIESAAHAVGTEIMKTYPKLETVTVILKKPEAPIKADFDYVAVEEVFTREEFEKAV